MPPIVERSGSFADHDVLALLKHLAGTRFSGALRLERNGTVKVLYLADGRLACASSTDPADRLGPLLEGDGRITAQQLALAEARSRAGEALGSVLVQLGFIGPGDLMWGARRQVEHVVASALTWGEGEFRSRPGPLPERAVNLRLELPEVILGAARSLADREEVLARLGSMDDVFRPTAGSPAPDLGDEARAVWVLLDGDRDLREVCSAAEMDDFEAAKVMLALSWLGFLEPLGRRAPAAPALPTLPGPDAAEAEPRSGEDDQDLGEVAGGDTGGMEEIGGTELLAQDEPVAGRVGPLDGSWGDPEEEAAALPFVDDPEADGAASANLAGWDSSGPDPENPSRGESARQGSPGAAVSTRTWMLGAALIVLAAGVLYILWGGGDVSTPLQAGAGALPAAMEPAAPAVENAVPPDGDTPALPGDTPSTAGDATPGATTSPPAVGTPASAGAVSAPTRPPVESAAGAPRLAAETGYPAGLEAFQAGNYPAAAAAWKAGHAAGHPGAFTLQLLVACEAGTLDRMRGQVDPASTLFLLPASVGGRPCYRACWGLYSDRAEAEAARRQVPAYFTAGGQRPLAVPLDRLTP